MPLFVTVTPGTTVSSTTTLSASTLNLLGTPSIDITGSVDGGTLSVADGSLTLAKFAPISGSRLIGNGNAVSAYPAELSSTDLAFTSSTVNIGTGAVTTAKLADSSSSATGVTYAKIQHVTDARLIGRSAGTNGVAQEITVGSGLSLASGALTNGILRYTTSLKDLPGAGDASQTVQWKTSLTELPAVVSSTLPQFIRVVLRCKTNDGDFVVGNELDVTSVVMDQAWNNGYLESAYPINVCTGMESASTTNIFLNVFFAKQDPGNRAWNPAVNGASNAFSQITYLNSTGSRVVLTRANWQVRAYLMYAPTWA
jgi:hypothetical protein